MLISIFSPTKNRAKTFVPQLLQSIETQILPKDWELEWVVCDDGSELEDLADLEELLAGSPITTVLIKHPQSVGVSVSRNDAFMACRGEYVLDVDDDDMLTSNAVVSRVQHLIDTRALWSFTDAATISEDNKIMVGDELLQNWDHNNLTKDELIPLLLDNKAWFWASTRTYRRDALFIDGKLIAWDPVYIVAQDLDHWVTLTNAIGPPEHLNAITTYWRSKNTSHGIDGRRSGLQAQMIASIRAKWATKLKIANHD